MGRQPAGSPSRARSDRAVAQREHRSVLEEMGRDDVGTRLQGGHVAGEGRDCSEGARHVGERSLRGGLAAPARKTRNAVINASTPETAAGAIRA